MSVLHGISMQRSQVSAFSNMSWWEATVHICNITITAKGYSENDAIYSIEALLPEHQINWNLSGVDPNNNIRLAGGLDLCEPHPRKSE